MELELSSDELELIIAALGDQMCDIIAELGHKDVPAYETIHALSNRLSERYIYALTYEG